MKFRKKPVVIDASNAQKLAAFLNQELGFQPDRVNKALEVLRESIPQVMWDIPVEQERDALRKALAEREDVL